MALADVIQLAPAKSTIHRVSGRSFLMVERYDRLIDGRGQRQRLHQEDFCQALGVEPEMKYQSEGGPDLVQCFDLVRRATRPSAPHLLRLFDYVIFNALIGNHDAHAKNLSLLYSGKSPVLAPFYDMLSTAVYPALTPKMAMKIGSKYKFIEVRARHWEQFAENVGLTRAQAKRRILELARLLPAAAYQLRSAPGYSFAGSSVVDKIIVLIDQRCTLTTRWLNDSADQRGA